MGYRELLKNEGSYSPRKNTKKKTYSNNGETNFNKPKTDYVTFILGENNDFYQQQEKNKVIWKKQEEEEENQVKNYFNNKVGQDTVSSIKSSAKVIKDAEEKKKKEKEEQEKIKQNTNNIKKYANANTSYNNNPYEKNYITNTSYNKSYSTKNADARSEELKGSTTDKVVRKVVKDNAISQNILKPLAYGLNEGTADLVAKPLATLTKNDETKAKIKQLEKESKKSSNKNIVSKASNFVGNMIPNVVATGITGKIPVGKGKTIGDGLNKLGNLTKNGYLNTFLREGTENALMEGALDLPSLIAGDKNIGKYSTDLGKEFALGGVFGDALKGVGDVSKLASKGLKNLDGKLTGKVNGLFDDVETSVKGMGDLNNNVRFVNKTKLPTVETKAEIPSIPNIKTNVDVNRGLSDIASLGNRKSELLSTQMPELKPYIDEEVQATLKELDDIVKGQRFVNYDDVTGETIVTGTKKQVSPTIQAIQDLIPNTTYEKIRNGLTDVLNGKSNALSKRIETILDDNLTNGRFSGNDGIEFPPVEEYVLTKKMYDALNNGKLDEFVKANSKTSLNQPQADLSNVKLTEQSIPQIKENLPQGQIKAIDDVAVSRLENEKLSRHANITAMDSPNVSDVIKNKIPEYNMTYEPVTLKGEYEKAVNEINNNPNAFEHFLNGKYKNSQNTAMGEALFKKYESEGDYDKALTVMSKLTTNLSKSGQEVAMARLLNSTTPEGRVKLAVQQVSKATDEVLTKNKKLNTKVESDTDAIINELNNKNKSTTEKKEILNNILTSKKSKIKKTQVDRLIELSNKGYLQNEDVRSAVLEKYGLGSIDAEDTKKIIELTKGLDNAKTTREKEIINAQIRKIINDKIPVSFMDKVDSFRFVNMLLNPKTLVKNFAGNVVNITAGQGRNVIANQIDNVASKFTGQKAVYNPNTKLFTGMKDGFKNVLEDHKLGIDTSYGTKEGVASSAFKDSKTPIGKLMNKSEKLLSTGLKLGDVPFSKGLEEQYIYGYMKNNNIKDVKDVPMEILEEARQVGREGTYQQDSKLANAINNFANTNAGTKLLVNAINPFIKTPINMAKTAIDYSPVGIGKGIKNFVDVATGNTDNALRSQRKGSEQIASGLIGTGLMGAGALASKNNNATANIDQDRDKRKFESQTGKLPYSLNVNGKNIGLEFMQPLTTSFMIGSDLGKGKNSVKDLANTGINSFANNSFMSGFTDLAQNIAYNGIGGAITGATENYAKQLLPFNSLANSVNKSIDNKQRETYSDSDLGSLGNQAMAKYPILSQMLPQKVDTLGQPMTYNDDTGTIGNILRNTIIPTNVASDKTSKQEDIINKLYQDTGSNTVFPYAPNGKDFEFRVGKDGANQKVQLTQDEYITYSQLVGNYINDHITSSMSEKDMKDIIADARANAKDEILKNRGYYKQKDGRKIYYSK